MLGLIMNVFVGLTLVTETQLGGLPEDKRYCAELVAAATRLLFTT